MYQSLLFLILFIFTGCLAKSDLYGVWFFELNIQENKIPFYMKFSNKEVILQNNSEQISLKYSKEKNKIHIPILNYDAALELQQIGNTLRGHWVKYNRTPEYKLKVFGMRTNKKNLPQAQEEYFQKSVNMRLEYDGETNGILTYQYPNPYSSIVTETGDYRYLTSKKINDNGEVHFYGFDGVFAFYLRGKFYKSGEYLGTLYSGLSYQKELRGSFAAKSTLRDSSKITTYNGNLKDITLKGLDRKEYNLKAKNKLTIIQIFGSWCPNCIDETKFLINWKKKNSHKDVGFKIVSFERSPNKEHAIKMLKKTQKLYNINYPILIGGYTAEDKVTSVFKGLNNFISFPTTIYIDSQNKIRKIEAGFNGPATGEFYESFTYEFDNFVNKILAE